MNEPPGDAESRRRPELTLGIVAGAWFAAVCLGIVFVDLEQVPYFPTGRDIAIGFVVGSLLGLPSVVATWTVFGSGAYWSRVVPSVPCLAIVITAFVGRIALHDDPPDVWRVVAVVSLCVFGQWALLQGALSPIRWGFGWTPRLQGEISRAATNQFTVRQLLIFTAIVATILGVGRSVVHSITLDRSDALLVFLAVGAALATLPTFIAALMPRWSALWIMGAFGFDAIVTWIEHPLLEQINSSPGIPFLACLNGFSTLTILVPAVAARSLGWRWTIGVAPSERVTT